LQSNTRGNYVNIYKNLLKTNVMRELDKFVILVAILLACESHCLDLTSYCIFHLIAEIK